MLLLRNCVKGFPWTNNSILLLRNRVFIRLFMSSLNVCRLSAVRGYLYRPNITKLLLLMEVFSRKYICFVGFKSVSLFLGYTWGDRKRMRQSIFLETRLINLAILVIFSSTTLLQQEKTNFHLHTQLSNQWRRFPFSYLSKCNAWKYRWYYWAKLYLSNLNLLF